jgi:Zn-dependent M28 family amino/carboxypeptidase
MSTSSVSHTAYGPEGILRALVSAPTAFDGRSDYGPFIAVGIPAGGLFTGAEGVKTAEQAAVYGGTAGVAYDVCYHQACDTFATVSLTGLDQMSDAAAHGVITWANSARPTAAAGARSATVKSANHARVGLAA